MLNSRRLEFRPPPQYQGPASDAGGDDLSRAGEGQAGWIFRFGRSRGFRRHGQHSASPIPSASGQRRCPDSSLSRTHTKLRFLPSGYCDLLCSCSFFNSLFNSWNELTSYRRHRHRAPANRDVVRHHPRVEKNDQLSFRITRGRSSDRLSLAKDVDHVHICTTRAGFSQKVPCTK